EDGRRHLRRNLFRATAMDRQLAEELLQWTKTEPGRKFTCTNVEFVTDYPGFGRQYRQVYEKIENLFSEAQRELLIETPYFIIMDEGQKILTDIEKRGADVVVL